MSQFFDINSRPDPDELIIQIADYVMDYEISELRKKLNSRS